MNLVDTYMNYINSLVIPNGYYPTRGKRGVAGAMVMDLFNDDLIPSNIISGQTIYGVRGSSENIRGNRANTIILDGVPTQRIEGGPTTLQSIVSTDGGILTASDWNTNLVATTINPSIYNQSINVEGECNIYLEDGTVIRARNIRVEMVN